jgi:hypothetical protein
MALQSESRPVFRIDKQFLRGLTRQSIHPGMDFPTTIVAGMGERAASVRWHVFSSSWVR